MRKEVGKMDYKFLLDIAIILASTKILGLFTKKVNMPQVVGALLAGVILGTHTETSASGDLLE